MFIRNCLRCTEGAREVRVGGNRRGGSSTKKKTSGNQVLQRYFKSSSAVMGRQVEAAYC